MESILIGVHLVAAIIITGLILMQQGKGADMGASFGSGASQTIFGSSGSSNFLSRSTTWMTVLFFGTSLTLAIIAKQRSENDDGISELISGDLDQINSELQQEAANAANEEVPDITIDPGTDDMPQIDIEAEIEGMPDVSVDETPETEQ